MSDIVRWGIIGIGNMANIFKTTLNEVKSTKIKAIASNNINKLKRYSSNFVDNKYCFNEYYDLISCDEIDAVYVTLPNSLHFETIKQCLKNKKHVLVEKPGLLTKEDAKEIKLLASNNHLLFAEGFSYIHNPCTNQIINIIKKGDIGKILRVEAQIGYNIVPKLSYINGILDRFKIQDKLFDPKLGGGCINDIGCYLLSFLQLITNLTESSILHKKTHSYHKKVDIDAKIKILSNDNILTELQCAFTKELESNIKIIGTNGKILISRFFAGIDVKIVFKNKVLENSKSRFKIPFSNQISTINKCILNDNINFQNEIYSRYCSVLNADFLERWRN